ncbi:MAG: hypothetical protein ACXWCZ_00305 [Flavisolibacter sp.]
MVKKIFSGVAAKNTSSNVKEIKYTDFFDSNSNIPGIRISLDNSNEIKNGFTLSISVIR